jgi:hypothetical protein
MPSMVSPTTLAHDALGYGLDRLARIKNVEHVVFGLAGRSASSLMNVDDILVPVSI